MAIFIILVLPVLWISFVFCFGVLCCCCSLFVSSFEWYFKSSQKTCSQEDWIPCSAQKGLISLQSRYSKSKNTNTFLRVLNTQLGYCNFHTSWFHLAVNRKINHPSNFLITVVSTLSKEERDGNRIWKISASFTVGHEEWRVLICACSPHSHTHTHTPWAH